MATRSAKKRKNPKNNQALALLLIGSGLLFIGVLALFVLPKPGERTTSSQDAASSNLPSVIPVEVDFPAPELQVFDLQGKAVALQDFRGKTVLVNNWATWCPPCKAEMPVLQNFYNEYRQEGFLILAIEAGEPPDLVAQFVDQYQLTFPVLTDPGQSAMIAFGNYSLPSSYLIDSSGQVRLAWTGAISREMLEKHVVPLIRE